MAGTSAGARKGWEKRRAKKAAGMTRLERKSAEEENLRAYHRKGQTARAKAPVRNAQKTAEAARTLLSETVRLRDRGRATWADVDAAQRNWTHAMDRFEDALGAYRDKYKTAYTA